MGVCVRPAVVLVHNTINGCPSISSRIQQPIMSTTPAAAPPTNGETVAPESMTSRD